MGVKLGLLTLQEGHRLRVFENRVLRRIFGLAMDEIMGGWRKLRNWELHNLYSLPIVNQVQGEINFPLFWSFHGIGSSTRPYATFCLYFYG
jgi:hypothetical protein